MRAFDRDLIRGGHYGQRSCEPHQTGRTHGCTDQACNVKILLANSEPSTHGTKRRFWSVCPMVASLIGRLGSSAFRLSTAAVLMSLRGLALLFGIGTKALPSWGSKTRWNNLTGGLAAKRTAG